MMYMGVPAASRPIRLIQRNEVRSPGTATAVRALTRVRITALQYRGERDE